MFRITRFWALTVLLSTLFAQTPRIDSPLQEALRKTGLRISVSPERPRSSRELRLGLQSAAGAERSPVARVIQRIERNDPPPRQRSPELSSDHLVIAVLDAQETVRHLQIVIDPRLVRGEFPDAAGNLQKTVIYRSDVELSVSIPGGIEAAEVRILSPSWESGELKLAPLASLKMAVSNRQ